MVTTTLESLDSLDSLPPNKGQSRGTIRPSAWPDTSSRGHWFCLPDLSAITLPFVALPDVAARYLGHKVLYTTVLPVVPIMPTRNNSTVQGSPLRKTPPEAIMDPVGRAFPRPAVDPDRPCSPWIRSEGQASQSREPPVTGADTAAERHV